MNVEYTARQVKISKNLRAQADEGVEKITRILGTTTGVSITFRAQRYQQIADVTIQARLQTIAAEGRSSTLESALREALDRAEHQAHRYRDRSRTRKRLPPEEKSLDPTVSRVATRVRKRPHGYNELVEEPKFVANTKTGKPSTKPTIKTVPRAIIPVHAERNHIVEPHILEASGAIVERPMTVEMAVKEVESGDRELLIFRNPTGSLYILHRRCDGNVEIVDLPY